MTHANFGERSARVSARRALFVALLAVALPLRAEVSESITFEYYDIHTKPDKDLRAALNAATPFREGQNIYHGYTKWYVKWQFRWKHPPGGACAIVSSKTALSGTVTMPRLHGSAHQADFERYVHALKEHEMGHVRIARQAAEAVDRVLLATPEKPDCAGLEHAANETAYRTLEHYKVAERSYDSDTAHGRTQGAWLDK